MIKQMIDDNGVLVGGLTILVIIALMATFLLCLLYIVVRLVQPMPSSVITQDVPSDVLAVIDNCIDANTSAISVNAGNVNVPIRSSDADGFIRCIYASGLELTFHGDPVQLEQ